MLFASVEQLIRQASIYAQKTAPEEALSIVGSDAGSSDAIELNTGLRLLNELIIFNNMNGNNLALLTNEQFNTTTGSSTLTLDGWSKILKIRYLLGNVWRDIPFNDLNTYLDEAVIQNSNGIPLTIYLQRTATGIIVNYFFPLNQNYVFDVWGYKSIDIFTNLSEPLTGFNQFYEVYYLYELAYRIQNYYQIPHTPYVLEQRGNLQNQLRNLKEKRIDKRVSATSQAGSNEAYSVLSLNLGRGYYP